jgi:hypothetical protein
MRKCSLRSFFVTFYVWPPELRRSLACNHAIENMKARSDA